MNSKQTWKFNEKEMSVLNEALQFYHNSITSNDSSEKMKILEDLKNRFEFATQNANINK